MKTSLRITSLLALGLHLTGIAAASDLGSSLPDNIQELTLLDSIHKLSAQNLNPNEYLAQMQPIVQNYEKNSSTDGRVERLSSAIVEMNLMSVDHLNEVKSSIVNQLSSNPSMSVEQRNQLEEKAILGSMKNLNGAPFSGGLCVSLFAAGGALVVGSIFADVVASTFTSSQSSSSVSVSGTGTAGGTSGSSSSSSNSGSTTTTSSYQSSSNTPQASEKKLILTSSFIGYGLGATALIFAISYEANDDCND